MTYCKRNDCIHYDVCAYKACKFVCPYYTCNTYDRPQGEWIPVSERLPDKNGKCLVSLDFGDASMDSFIDGIFVCYLGNVIAWQPLPESYKKGGVK